MRTPTIKELQKLFVKLGYPFYDRGDNNLNTIGIRSVLNDENGETVPDRFNDLIVVCYKVRGEWRLFAYKATTIPGLHYFQQPYDPAYGTGIIVPGFYKGVYELGLHFGKPALQQVGLFKCYRDGDRDSVIDLDPATVREGRYAMNLHYSWHGATTVHNGSAGCQVVAYGSSDPEYIELIGHYQAALKAGQPKLCSYALVLEKDLV